MQRRIDGCPNCGRHTVAYAWEPDGEGVRMHFRCTACGREWFTGYWLPPSERPAWSEKGKHLCASN